MTIPVSAKIAFLRFLDADTKQEIQKLRGKAAYHMFNAGIIFDLARDKENNVDAWIQYVTEMLEPNLTEFSES